MSGPVGHAEAARQNREHAERVGILQALRRLGIPSGQWPNFVQAYERDYAQKPLYSQIFSPPAFHPPYFDRLNQSPAEWRQKAEAEFRSYCDRFLRGEEYWIEKGANERVPPATQRRGPGQVPHRGKRQNTPFELRYEFAARRLCGALWKQIAADCQMKESAVMKAGSDVLRRAGWFRKPKTKHT